MDKENGDLIFSLDISLDSHSTICTSFVKWLKYQEILNVILANKKTWVIFVFPILSCSAFNSAFVANITIFLFKSELFITPEMSDVLTKSFSLSLNQVSHLWIYYN